MKELENIIDHYRSVQSFDFDIINSAVYDKVWINIHQKIIEKLPSSAGALVFGIIDIFRTYEI